VSARLTVLNSTIPNWLLTAVSMLN